MRSRLAQAQVRAQAEALRLARAEAQARAEASPQLDARQRGFVDYSEWPRLRTMPEETDARHVSALVNLGSLLRGRGEFVAAEECFRVARTDLEDVRCSGRTTLRTTSQRPRRWT